MKRQKTIPYLSSLMIMVLLVATVLNVPARAAENPLLVELPQEINNSLSRVLTLQEQSDQSIACKEREIAKVVKKILPLKSNPEKNRGEIYALQKEYLALRGEVLYLYADKTDRIEKEFQGIAINMDRLEQARRNSGKAGLGSGISRDDEKAKAAISKTFQGFGFLGEMIEAINPDASLDGLQSSLMAMKNTAKNFFNSPAEQNMDKEKRFVKETLIACKAMQRIFAEEHDYLLQKLFFVDANNTIGMFGEVEGVFKDPTGIRDKFTDMRETDNNVLGSGHPGGTYRTNLAKTNDWAGLKGGL